MKAYFYGQRVHTGRMVNVMPISTNNKEVSQLGIPFLPKITGYSNAIAASAKRWRRRQRKRQNNNDNHRELRQENGGYRLIYFHIYTYLFVHRICSAAPPFHLRLHLK